LIRIVLAFFVEEKEKEKRKLVWQGKTAPTVFFLFMACNKSKQNSTIS